MPPVLRVHFQRLPWLVASQLLCARHLRACFADRPLQPLRVPFVGRPGSSSVVKLSPHQPARTPWHHQPGHHAFAAAAAAAAAAARAAAVPVGRRQDLLRPWQQRVVARSETSPRSCHRSRSRSCGRCCRRLTLTAETIAITSPAVHSSLRLHVQPNTVQAPHDPSADGVAT